MSGPESIVMHNYGVRHGMRVASFIGSDDDQAALDFTEAKK